MCAPSQSQYPRGLKHMKPMLGQMYTARRAAGLPFPEAFRPDPPAPEATPKPKKPKRVKKVNPAREYARSLRLR